MKVVYRYTKHNSNKHKNNSSFTWKKNFIYLLKITGESLLGSAMPFLSSPFQSSSKWRRAAAKWATQNIIKIQVNGDLLMTSRILPQRFVIKCKNWSEWKLKEKNTLHIQKWDSIENCFLSKSYVQNFVRNK